MGGHRIMEGSAFEFEVLTTGSGFKLPVLAFVSPKQREQTWTAGDIESFLLHASKVGTISDVYISTGKFLKCKITSNEHDGVITVIKKGFKLSTLGKDHLEELWMKLGIKISDITNLKQSATARAALQVPNSDKPFFFRAEGLNYTSQEVSNGYTVCLRPLQRARKFESLMVHPLVLKYYSKIEKGMHLTLGKTGTGKSTTLSSILDLLVRIYPKVLYTLEKPIEYLIAEDNDKLGEVFQLDTNENLNSFAQGASSMLRNNPDYVLFGELKDKDEIRSALELANASPAVFATAHTDRVWNAYARIVKKLPEDTKHSNILDLISEIHSIGAQMLIKSKSGGKIIINEFIYFYEEERQTLSEIYSDCVRNESGIAIFVQEFKKMMQLKESKGEAVSFEKHLQERLDNGLITMETFDNTQNKLSIDIV